VLFIALAIGLIVRAVLFWQTPAMDTEIVDEQHYVALARNVLAGNGIAWGPGEPTSIRPPLYPAFLAAIWGVAGVDLQVVRVVQFLLTLLTTGLVYQIGRRMFSPVVGRYAAAVTWLYPSLIFFNFTMLTETLYVCLLTGFLLLSVMLVTEPRAATAVGCGLALGFACLTRSALWPLPLVLCPLLVVLLRGPLKVRFALAAAVFIGYGLVVGPWAVRNTRLQGVVTIVDTMGGLNLHMGNYAHTPDDRMWDAVALRGEKHWAYPIRNQEPPPTEGQKEKWAQRQALSYIAANPLMSLRRAAIKFADFWGLERELAAGFAQGLYEAPSWFAVLAPTLVAVAYAVVALAGTVGFWLVRARDWRTEVLLLLPVVGITAVHTIVFGHSRYHLPLVPILALYGAALMQHLVARVPGLISRVPPRGLRRAQLAGAAASVAVLVVIWSRQLLLVDADRINSFLAHVR
jgi:4-amino-4-deoxy-L-arabinose transferase-like glycosyltransferase